MASVGNVGRAAGPSAAGSARRTVATGGFTLPTSEAPARAAPAGAAAAVSMEALLTLQQAPGEGVRDREARRHGEAMLRLLAALQRAALGAPGREAGVLAELEGLAASVPDAGDARLRQAVASVVLRARIELARRR